jgi:tripartite-type tricarboxylate transporter receptor subunit TctC
MRIDRRQLLQTAGAGLTASATGHVALAQTYPAHPVRVIVPYAGGGPPDLTARLLAQKLSEGLGQQFFVENLPGAGGNTGVANASRATADGYTLLVISTGFFVNPSLYARVPYDPIRDFAPLSLIASSPNVLMVNRSVPARTLTELVDLVRANPGKLSYAHASTGSTPHLAGELLKLRFGLDLVTVPFNSGPQAIMSAIGGHTPIAITALPSALPNVKDGRVRAIAVTGPKRAAVLPDVPTMKESGADDQESETLNGILAPAATPRAIIDLLHREVAKVMASADVRERMFAMGFEPMATTPEEFGERTKAEIAKWGKVIRDARIRMD